MKSKKAMVLKEFLETILALAVIILLGMLAMRFFGIFTSDTPLEQAKGSLDKIVNEVNFVYESGMNSEVFLESPTGWRIFSFSSEKSMPVQCSGKYCLCICEDNCNVPNKTACSDVFVEVKLRGDYSGGEYLIIDMLKSFDVYKEEEKIVLEGDNTMTPNHNAP